MPKGTASESSELRRRLREAKARGESLAKTAAGAKIATRAIVLINDEAAWDKKIATAKEHGKARRLAGYASSVTRLAVYLGMRPVDALKELGFDTNHPDVKKAAETATVHAQRKQLVQDPTLATIKGRAAATSKHSGIAKVAVLNWRPFYDDDYAGSFAKRYVRMLLQAIDPTWEIDDTPLDQIDKATNGVLADPAKFDIVFGLYSLPFRQSIGLRFVDVPGLRVPLGIVARSPSTLTWERVIGCDDYSNVRALALKEEAGFHFIAGACGYPVHREKDLIAEHQPDSIAQAVVLKLDEARRFGREGFFIADVFTCRAVEVRINRWANAVDRPRELGDISVPQVKLLACESERNWVPSYAVGLGMRADAEVFARLLNEATCVDLFYNAALRMAKLYFELLRKPESKDLVIEPLAFDALGPEHRRRFFDAYTKVFDETVTQQGFQRSDLKDTKAAELLTIATPRTPRKPESATKESQENSQ